MKTCIICGKEFEVRYGGQKCCSKECSKINKQNYESNPKRISWVKQYDKSDKRKKQHALWRQSDKGKEWLLKYKTSGKQKEYYTLYHQSEIYKASERKEERIKSTRKYRKEYVLRPGYKERKSKYRKERWNLLPTTPLVNRRKRMKRRAAKNNIIENFTPEQFSMKAEQCKGICPSCKEPFNKEDKSKWLTIDHVYPVSKANEDFKVTGIKRIYNIENVEPLCFGCNSRKKDKISLI